MRRWGILWRPMEVGLARFPGVVNCVVRMHNFCRDRMVDVPVGNVGAVTVPEGVSFNKDGAMDNDYFEPQPARSGRPMVNQVSASKPREQVRRGIEIGGFGRPAHNMTRNGHRTGGSR